MLLRERGLGPRYRGLSPAAPPPRRAPLRTAAATDSGVCSGPAPRRGSEHASGLTAAGTPSAAAAPCCWTRRALVVAHLLTPLCLSAPLVAPTSADIKKEFDKKYGPTWHCVVGRNFGSYVTHETKNFVYFYLGQVRGAWALRGRGW